MKTCFYLPLLFLVSCVPHDSPHLSPTLSTEMNVRKCEQKGDIHLKMTAPIHGNHVKTWATPAKKLVNELWAYHIKDTPYTLAFYPPNSTEDSSECGHYVLRKGDTIVLTTSSYFSSIDNMKPRFAVKGGAVDTVNNAESFFIYLSPNNDGLVIVESGLAAAVHEIGPMFFSWKDAKPKLVVCDGFSYNHRAATLDEVRRSSAMLYYDFEGWGGSEPIISVAKGL